MSRSAYRHAVLAALRSLATAGCELDRVTSVAVSEHHRRMTSQARNCVNVAAEVLRTAFDESPPPAEGREQTTPALLETKS